MGGLSERVTFEQRPKVEKDKTSGQGKRFQAKERTSVNALRQVSLGKFWELKGDSEGKGRPRCGGRNSTG